MTAPLACDLTALEPDERAAHLALVHRLIGRALRGVAALPDGVALAFGPDDYDDVARFIAGERRCCPFLRFELEVAPSGGPLRLRLTGPPGAAAFIRAELHLPET